jgi:acetolactate synthase I/II/III large subunit
MTAQASIADVLIGALAEAGIENVFGLPGGEVAEVLDSIRRSEIDFTLVHHESSAAFMASATARLAGRPSACLATLGPGSSNIVTGVAHAYLDRAPVIVITAETSQQDLPHHTHQVLDHEALFSPITKASFRLKPDGVHEMVRKAITLATTGRPGPVHMQISSDVAATETSAPKPGPTLPSSEPAGNDKLQRARQLLSDSKRPILIAGLGLEPEGPYEELRHFAEAVHAPVIVTPKAKGAISEDHPLAVGTIGLTRSDPAYEVLDQADCVVAVGFDVVELVKPWEHSAPLIWLAPWPNQDPRLPAAAEVTGPIGPPLRSLAEAKPHPGEDWGAKIVAAHRGINPSLRSTSSSSERLAPQAVLRVLREYLDREALITTDVGSHKILTCLEWPAFVPNRFLVSNGLSSMGYSLSAAIAAGLSLRDTSIVCTVGDAGLLMSMGELATLARLDIPVTVVVFKDHALDLIRSHQNRVGHPTYGTEFTAPDFVQIAEAHGIPAQRVSTEDALTMAVKRFIPSMKPGLIEAEIDPSTYSTLAHKR